VRITFIAKHPYWSQLTNNGGTRTIVKSAEALIKLGHTVDIVCKSNRYTWGPCPQTTKKIPSNSDAYIAVTPSDVIYLPKPGYLWLRGLHSWSMSEKKLLDICKKTNVITNATHLTNWLAKRGVHSRVFYSGLDLDFWTNFSAGFKNADPPVVGCLYHKFHKSKGYKQAKKIIKKTDSTRIVLNKGKYTNLCMEQMNDVYCGCDIWLSTTTNEGFHNIPAEAALCGCLVVCNRHPNNGMDDYATEDTAMRFDTTEEAAQCLRHPDYSKVKKMQEVLINKIGSREQNMKKLVDLLYGE